MGGVVALETLVLWGVYWLNQTTVRSDLEPRRRELQSLLTSLNGGDASAELPPPSGDGRRLKSSSRWATVFQIALGCVVVVTLVSVIYEAATKDRDAETATTGPESSVFCPTGGDAIVTNLLVPIRPKHDVPALTAALVTSKGITVVGVAGVRKRGTEVPATLDDLWHLGSDTKAMTATLVAKLVEQGRLKWETTVAEVFPELADKFHPDRRGVTLLHLLSHRSGLRPNLDLGRFLGDDVKELRLRAVREALAKKPSHKPGSHYEYSNLGYIIVGAVVERVTGKTWEEAMREGVFTPLKMTSVGFGGTGTRGQLDQPWPHHGDGKPLPENGPAMDNPPVMGPAGRVHCTIQDWAKFVQDQLRGARGEPALLKPASYLKMHTPPFGGEYALGWLVVERDWGGGTVLNHGGDNTMNCANVWVAPKRDFAILVCVNQSGDTAFQASDEVVGALIKLHASKEEPALSP
jgi:CubicO group peptidase (beta-lactamase class C family)